MVAAVLCGRGSAAADCQSDDLLRRSVKWARFVWSRPAEFRSLWNRWDAHMRLLVQKVNRKDAAYLRRGGMLIHPEEAVPLLWVSPFPPCLEELSFVPKLVLVSQRLQAFAAYENGRLVCWGAVSTGTKLHPTPNGLYHANWRSRLKRSTINRSWLMPWYVNLHTSMGVAFHQYALPGRPASYGCIRLLEEDARWLYSWLELSGSAAAMWGTPVLVFGEFQEDQTPPWEAPELTEGIGKVEREEIEPLITRYGWALRQRTGPDSR